MLLVDERIGSRELLAPLIKAGLPAELDHLDFADVAFAGRGVAGKPLTIGVELKNLGDLVSSMVSKRLPGHQLPGLIRTYDPDLTGQRVYLIVEGEWRTNAQGKLLRRAGPSIWKPIQGAPPASAMRKRLLTLATRAGVTVWPTLNRAETVAFIADLYRFWTDEDLDQHKSHLAIYSPDMDRALLRPPSIFRTVLGGLPGVGPKVLDAAEREFGSIAVAVAAPVERWASLRTLDNKGHPRLVGGATAARIVQAITKEKQ